MNTLAGILAFLFVFAFVLLIAFNSGCAYPMEESVLCDTDCPADSGCASCPEPSCTDYATDEPTPDTDSNTGYGVIVRPDCVDTDAELCETDLTACEADLADCSEGLELVVALNDNATKECQQTILEYAQHVAALQEQLAECEALVP